MQATANASQWQDSTSRHKSIWERRCTQSESTKVELGGYECEGGGWWRGAFECFWPPATLLIYFFNFTLFLTTARKARNYIKANMQ
jgi:hypothetical protein